MLRITESLKIWWIWRFRVIGVLNIYDEKSGGTGVYFKPFVKEKF